MEKARDMFSSQVSDEDFCKKQIIILLNFKLEKLNKSLYSKNRWKIFKRYCKDHEYFEFEDRQYILILSDCKQFIELIEDDEGSDYSTSIGSSESSFHSSQYDSEDDETFSLDYTLE